MFYDMCSTVVSLLSRGGVEGDQERCGPREVFLAIHSSHLVASGTKASLSGLHCFMVPEQVLARASHRLDFRTGGRGFLYRVSQKMSGLPVRYA